MQAFAGVVCCLRAPPAGDRHLDACVGRFWALCMHFSPYSDIFMKNKLVHDQWIFLYKIRPTCFVAHTVHLKEPPGTYARVHWSRQSARPARWPTRVVDKFCQWPRNFLQKLFYSACEHSLGRARCGRFNKANQKKIPCDFAICRAFQKKLTLPISLVRYVVGQFWKNRIQRSIGLKELIKTTCSIIIFRGKWQFSKMWRDAYRNYDRRGRGFDPHRRQCFTFPFAFFLFVAAALSWYTKVVSAKKKKAKEKIKDWRRAGSNLRPLRSYFQYALRHLATFWKISIFQGK